MSTVAVTDLIPGEAATSADVNATMTSWNTATAAGAIDVENVRPEGIDRRSLSATNHVVDSELVGTNSPIERVTASGNVTNTTGTAAVITYGDGTLATAEDITLTSGRKLVVHASLYVRGGTLPTSLAATLPAVWVVLQKSTDGGAAWSTLSGTRRTFRLRDVRTGTGMGTYPAGGAGTNIPRVARSINIVYDATTLGVAQRFRVAFETENYAFNFINGTIWCEVMRSG